MSWKPEVDEIKKRRELALAQGGADAVAKQHSQNRLTIRERVDQLLDEGSFEGVRARRRDSGLQRVRRAR